jgi:hypothetical protein
LLLALDWRKAFDSISPDRLIWALGRFGVGEPMLSIIKEIYTGRHFTVADAGEESINRPQLAGISQGCPFISCSVWNGDDRAHDRREECPE